MHYKIRSVSYNAFNKRALKVGKSTPNVMIYGEISKKSIASSNRKTIDWLLVKTNKHRNQPSKTFKYTNVIYRRIPVEHPTLIFIHLYYYCIVILLLLLLSNLVNAT